MRLSCSSVAPSSLRSFSHADRVQPEQAVLLVSAELDLDLHGLDQFGGDERREHGLAHRHALADAVEDTGHAIEVAAVAALRQEHRLAFGLADTRIIQIHVDHRLAAQLAAVLLLLEADQERPARDDAGT